MENIYNITDAIATIKACEARVADAKIAVRSARREMVDSQTALRHAKRELTLIQQKGMVRCRSRSLSPEEQQQLDDYKHHCTINNTDPAILAAELTGTPNVKREREAMHDSRQDVNTAGRMLVGFGGDLGTQQALDIINNWRSSHAFPLNAFHVTLRGRARNIDVNALTAQRIKRLPSIALKLARFQDMKLSQMQDLGGCRAVVKTMAHVDRLVAAYKRAIAKNPKSRHEFVHDRDYITDPKSDGYRSYHMIYRYRSGARKHQPYNGLKIEIQIRTKLQHAWATAVEIVSTFTGQALKSNIGDDSWKLFFKLMSTNIALREGRPPVPDTPFDRNELRGDLQNLVEKLHVNDVMMGCGTGLKMIEKDISKGRRKSSGHTYLVILDSRGRSTRTIAYSREQLPQAQHDYLESEKENNDKPWIQSVLVSVDSVAALRRAYPNFFLDSMAFLNAVDQAIREPNTSKQST